MKSKENSRNRLSYWQLIFCKSKVNGAPHKDDDLPVSNWDWPTDTYLSSRRSRNEPRVGAGECRGAASERRTGAGV